MLLELYSSRHLSGYFDEMKALVKVNGKPLPPIFWGLFVKELEGKGKSDMSDEPPAKRPALNIKYTTSGTASTPIQRTISYIGKWYLGFCVYHYSSKTNLFLPPLILSSWYMKYAHTSGNSYLHVLPISTILFYYRWMLYVTFGWLHLAREGRNTATQLVRVWITFLWNSLIAEAWGRTCRTHVRGNCHVI